MVRGRDMGLGTRRMMFFKWLFCKHTPFIKYHKNEDTFICEKCGQVVFVNGLTIKERLAIALFWALVLFGFLGVIIWSKFY
jgi:hypothetical protein